MTDVGVLLIDKPVGVTSHDVVDWVRWALKTKRVGHCGTLDPAATGLLVVCVGAATRAVEFLTGVDKVYAARFVLGRSTTTDDADGEVVQQVACDDAVVHRAAQTLQDMIGELELPPPAYSAVRDRGRRAHAAARAGEPLELDARTMHMRSVEIGGCRRLLAEDDAGGLVELEAVVRVGKGTYVRSLAVELGRRLGTVAHLGALRRRACGSLDVGDPRALGGFAVERLPPSQRGKPRVRMRLAAVADDRDSQGGAVRRCMLPLPDALPFEVVRFFEHNTIPSWTVGLTHGQTVTVDPAALGSGGDPIAVMTREVLVIAAARAAEDGRVELRPKRVLAGVVPEL